MKRLGAIVCLAALIITMAVSVCFGAKSQLVIVDKYPEDGQKSTSIENMSVKLHFNNEMGNKSSVKANEKAFRITDNEGKQIPIRIFYNPKDAKEVMVLADTVKIAENKNLMIKDNTEYTLHISKDVTDNQGNTLGKEETVSFTTLNQSQNTKVYMVMMVVMFGGMFIFTSRQAKRQMAKQEEEFGREEAFNPYKEAKRTGKSVQEVIAAHEKEVAKKEARAARKAKKSAAAEDDDFDDAEQDNGNYKVKGPRPVSAGGSSFITGRKAIAEARIAEEERLAKRRAAAGKKKKK